MMNSEVMVKWLNAMVQGMPHGGKKRAAEKLGLTPSGLSKLLNNPQRGFDEKTLNAVAWVEKSKAGRYPEDKFPILNRVQVGPIVVEIRQGAGGEEFPVWKPAE